MLNNDQLKAVNSNAQKILVLAGAGSGKSHTLLSRISRLIDDGVDVSNILTLTFTNAAAIEMRERYRNTHKNILSPKFCTFHAFCYSLVAGDPSIRRKLGYIQVPNIADDSAIKKIAAMCRNQCGTKLSEDKLSGKEPLTPKDRFQYDIYWKQYNKLLRKNNLITFDIMCYEVCKLFSSDDPAARQYKAQYKYIFVDEFQDTDPKQWDFVSSFKQSNLFVVGDAKQAIYSFRGADSSIIKSLAENEEWENIRLSQNYRSTEEICEFSNKIHESWKNNAYNLEIHSDKSGEDVHINKEFHYYGDSGTKDLLSMLDGVDQNESIALLCRTNAEVADVKKLLSDSNICYRTNATNKATCDLLKCAIDSSYMVDYLSSRLNTNEYNEYIKLCAVNSQYETEDGFMSIVSYAAKLSGYTDIIYSIRSILQSDIFAYQKCVDICNLLHLNPSAIQLDSESNESIIQYVMQIADRSTVNTNIYVGTIHSVKGLEFDIVHLLGVNGKSFPINKNEEQKNLYYVGCTRAKKSLTIWVSNDYK